MRWVEVLNRVRFLLPASALLTLLLTTRFADGGSLAVRVTYDYSVWYSTVVVVVGVLLDLRALGWTYSYCSTLLLSLLSALVVLIGRVSSLVINCTLYLPYDVMPLFGSRYTRESFFISLVLASVGVSLSLVSLSLHSALGRPLVFREGRPVNAVIASAWNRLRLAFSTTNLYLPSSFLLGFTLRFIPELIWWPWHIGWDTVEYVAHLEDFMVRLNPFASYYWMGGLRNIPPMLNLVVLVPAHAFSAWAVFKVYPAVAYGLLCLSSALLAKTVFRTSGWGAFLTSAITAFYVLNLRISWDYQRQLLGSVFMLLSLAVLDRPGRWGAKRAATAAALLVCSALSHEVTGFFATVASLTLLLKSALNRELWGASAGSIALAASVALELWYWGVPYTEVPGIGTLPAGLVSYFDVDASEVISYLFAGFGTVLPLALLSLLERDSRCIYCGIALASLLLAGLSPLLAPYTSVAVWYRFMVGAAPIASTLAGAWVAKFSGGWRFQLAYITLLMVLAFPFAYTVFGATKYAYSMREFPLLGLTPLPNDQKYLEDLAEVAKVVKNLDPGIAVVAPDWVARWVHLSKRNPSPSELVWVWPRLNSTIDFIVRELKLSKAYLITPLQLKNSTDLVVVEVWSGKVLYLYYVETKTNQ
ncbi:MAG: hypothetical protein QXM78_06020 [Sulfolobales archaeon]